MNEILYDISRRSHATAVSEIRDIKRRIMCVLCARQRKKDLGEVERGRQSVFLKLNFFWGP